MVVLCLNFVYNVFVYICFRLNWRQKLCVITSVLKTVKRQFGAAGVCVVRARSVHQETEDIADDDEEKESAFIIHEFRGAVAGQLLQLRPMSSSSASIPPPVSHNRKRSSPAALFHRFRLRKRRLINDQPYTAYGIISLATVSRLIHVMWNLYSFRTHFRVVTAGGQRRVKR